MTLFRNLSLWLGLALFTASVTAEKTSMIWYVKSDPAPFDCLDGRNDDDDGDETASKEK